jgi:hypothetical protein
MRRALSVLTFLVAVSAHAGEPYIRILLPIYIAQPIPGAFGSNWKSDFAVHNGASHSFIVETCSPLDGSGCTLLLANDEELVPNETETALPQRYLQSQSTSNGAVLYLFSEGQPDDGSSLSFQLRVRDISRNASSAGTEVPVVRDGALRHATASLLDVPVDPNFRLTLRLYEVDLDQSDFLVRVFDQSTNDLLSEQAVHVAAPPHGALRFQPGYAQLADFVPANASASPRVRVEIQPLTQGSTFWSFVSITNNDTQEFTLVTPQ